jgi:hypothetical protein
MSEPQVGCVFFRPNWFSNCSGRLYEHNGKQYCVLHLPSEEKGQDFDDEIQRRLNEDKLDFSSVWFPREVMFDGPELRGGLYLVGATFNAGVAFRSVKFRETIYLSSATFNIKADFESARFAATADFAGAVFNVEANFEKATFSGETSFSGATFNAGTNFENATFNGKTTWDSAVFSADANIYKATFSKDAPASFASAKFGTKELKAKANFCDTVFGGEADFNSAVFSDEVSLAGATFESGTNFDTTNFGGDATLVATFKGDVSFRDPIFNAEVYFGGATFHEGVSFIGTQKYEPSPLSYFWRLLGVRDPSSDEDWDNVFSSNSSMEFRYTNFHKPDQVSFRTLGLRPHWFGYADALDFQFINVDWKWSDTKNELSQMARRAWVDGSSAHRLLSIACQRLATNAENNNQYEDASRFRYLSMDARRLGTGRGFALWKLSWWYWLASGYGERSFQALVVLLGILFSFAVLYQQVGFARWEPRLVSEPDAIVAKRDATGAPLELGRATSYSAGVMMLQKPEPRPATPAAQGLVVLETILGPVQAALLALAIRRKFMR